MCITDLKLALQLHGKYFSDPRVRPEASLVTVQVHVQAFTVVPSRSGVVRSLSERAVLEVFMSRMAALSLSGYIFFGSSVKIAEQVKWTSLLFLIQNPEFP